jgi:hypothetical protein
MFIDLSQAKLLAVGGRSWVYVHPDDPSLLVKVIRSDIYKRWPVVLHGVRRRYLHSTILQREMREHKSLRAADPNPPWFLQKTVGLAETSLGSALVVKAERGREGEYAETLSKLARSGRLTDEMRAQLERFIAAFLASPVVAGDIRLSNIVHAYTPEHGDHFVLIDGIGDRTFVPVQRLVPPLNQLIKRRRLVLRLEKLAGLSAGAGAGVQ